MKKFLVVMLAFAALFAGCKKESSEKRILKFEFTTLGVEATISEGAKTIVAQVPEGTDVTNLVPTITISQKASVDPASGVPQNFTNPKTYVVTAEDGSNTSYTVTVTKGSGGGGGGGGQATDPTTIDGSISDNTTWPDLGLPVDYIIDGYCYIEGNAMLTIEPGVTIMFTGVNGAIIVEENAGINMVGTPDKHIRLVNPTNNNNKGAWGFFRIESNRADNKMEYVDFINGGSNDGGEVLLVNGTLSMKHCLIDGSLGKGMYVSGKLKAFENNTIKNCDSYPLAISEADHINQLGTGNTYTANTINMIWFNHYWIDNGTENSTFTFTNQGIPYHLTEGMNVDENNTLLIDPGCEFVVAYDKEVVVSDGSLFQVNGNPGVEVKFRGESNEAGTWRGLKVRTSRHSGTNVHSWINSCIIEGAGIDDDGALYTNEDTWLSLYQVTLKNSGSYGLNICIPLYYNESTGEYQYDYASHHVFGSSITFDNCASGNIWERQRDVVLNELP